MTETPMTVTETIAAYQRYVEETGGARARDDRVDANRLFHAALNMVGGYTDEELTDERFVNSLIDLGVAMVRYSPHAAQFSRMMSAD